MAQELLDLKVVALDRVYPRVPKQTLSQWAMEGRIAQGDLVRASGTEAWQAVWQFPWLAASMPTGVLGGATIAGEEQADLEADAAAAWVAKRSKKKHDEAVMDMTPMIDVTFQLLIFFMLTNSLANPAPLDVAEAEYGRGVTPEGKQMILVDQQGQYYLGEAAVEENISPSLDALVDEVRSNAANAPAPLEVIVTAHKKSLHKYQRELVDRLGSVPNLGNIRLGVEEKRK
jgi:biopolymer transport protein ExbD